MKTKQERLEEKLNLFEKMKQETILRYAYEIEFDTVISLYDVMINHLANGDLDDIFLTDVVEGMSDDERKELFSLAREFKELCFIDGDSDKWLMSVENTGAKYYDLIAYSVFDNYNYLLSLAKYGGRSMLEQLSSLNKSEGLEKNAIIGVLRNSFIDDSVLTAVLTEMTEENSKFDIFTDEQKAVLLTYPEGVLYSYGKLDEVNIVSPLLLARQIYNNISDESIKEINDYNISDVQEFFKSFTAELEFSDEVLSLNARHRDCFRQRNLAMREENIKINFEPSDTSIQRIWSLGDPYLGSSYDTPYSSGTR